MHSNMDFYHFARLRRFIFTPYTLRWIVKFLPYNRVRIRYKVLFRFSGTSAPSIK